jgi:hypothetical protein
LSFWLKGFYKGEGMADTRDRGFCEELDDLLRRSEKSLQQGPLACFAFFWWMHHVHKLLGGPLSFSTSSVRRYSIFFTSVSSSSLYVKIFLSSAVKIFSESKENC